MLERMVYGPRIRERLGAEVAYHLSRAGPSDDVGVGAKNVFGWMKEGRAAEWRVVPFLAVTVAEHDDVPVGIVESGPHGAESIREVPLHVNIVFKDDRDVIFTVRDGAEKTIVRVPTCELGQFERVTAPRFTVFVVRVQDGRAGIR